MVLFGFHRIVMKNLPKCLAFIDVHDIPAGSASKLSPNFAGECVLVGLVHFSTALWARVIWDGFSHYEGISFTNLILTWWIGRRNPSFTLPITQHRQLSPMPSPRLPGSAGAVFANAPNSWSGPTL